MTLYRIVFGSWQGCTGVIVATDTHTVTLLLSATGTRLTVARGSVVAVEGIPQTVMMTLAVRAEQAGEAA